ncbi:MAG: hypothetical protein V3U87_05065 [Methylococcaceae bacterium]
MPNCSFCGIEEEKDSPICQSCGAIRYPIENNTPSKTVKRQQKLKFSAFLAATIVTPGSLIVLALLGANRINAKNKNKKG